MGDMEETEFRIVLAIARKTFGWHKREDQLSLTQLKKLTGLSRPSIVKGIALAIEHEWIARRPKGQSFLYSLLVNDVYQFAEKVVNDVDSQLVNDVYTQNKEELKKEEPLHAQKPRVRSMVEIEVERLMVIFIEETDIPIRKMASQAEITKLWRNPMRDIIALSNGQSEWLLKETIHHMRSQNPALTIKTPNSLLGCAPDVWSRYRPPQNNVHTDPMQPYFDMLAEQEKTNAAQNIDAQ